jgi:DNA-binding response OmpR family regulator
MNNKKVLIIEDEVAHLGVLRSKMESEGYSVETASDGASGFELIKSGDFDIILLDILLPKMNGFEVLEKMKEENITTPVIVVSNSGQPVEIDKAMNLGVRDYLVKAEFNPADVIGKIQKVLGIETTEKDSSSKNNDSEKQGRILIVEDDKFLRDLMVQKLHQGGFEVFEAIDGEGGLKLANEKSPHLILLDLILPGMDGFAVLKSLKDDSTTSTIPVLVLSNLGQKEEMERAISIGAEDFMVKANFTPSEILSKIKSLIKKKYF